MVYPNSRILVLKIYELSSQEKIWMSLNCMLLTERSQSESLHTIYLYIYIHIVQLHNILEGKNYSDSIKINGFQGGGGMNK